jgi:hypothetical protein
VLPASTLVTEFVLLTLRLAGAVIVAVWLADKTDVSVLRSADVKVALFVTVPVVLAFTVALTVSVSVDEGAKSNAAIGKLKLPGQAATQGAVLVALQLTLPRVAPADTKSATVTLVAVTPALLLLMVKV